MEKGNFRLEKKSFDINGALSDFMQEWKSRAAMSGITINMDIAKGLPVLFADQKRLGQVIMNLLENAVRHTHSGGKITVSVSADSDSMLFSVSDNGSGIAKDDMSCLVVKII